MIISELIKKLQEIQTEYGDIEVNIDYFDVDDDSFIITEDNILNLE